MSELGSKINYSTKTCSKRIYQSDNYKGWRGSGQEPGRKDQNMHFFYGNAPFPGAECWGGDLAACAPTNFAGVPVQLGHEEHGLPTCLSADDESGRAGTLLSLSKTTLSLLKRMWKGSATRSDVV